jgi:hypothetical protein
MTKILCLDTATDICSVALFENKTLISARESGDDRSHATKLAVFIDEVLREAKISAKELSAGQRYLLWRRNTPRFGFNSPIDVLWCRF